MARPIYVIAQDITNEVTLERRLGKPAGWFVYAKPYVEAMYSLETIDDSFGYDSGLSVVSYALANLGSWRGETAKSIKAELKAHLKGGN